ncbi:MAG: SH3 domain-containing protein [Aeromicrobium sp.]
MADQSHKHAAPRTRRRRSRTSSLSLSVLPAVGLLTVVGAGVAAVVHNGAPVDASSAVSSARVASSSADASAGTSAPRKDVFAAAASQGQAPATVSRSAERPPVAIVAEVEAEIEGLRYAVTPIEIHADAKSGSPVLATAASGDEVDITGETNGKWAEIIHNGVPRWVEASALAAEMPLGTEPCAYGSEGGLQPDTVKVLRAVCAKFPSITSYGGIAGRGEHATGHSLDIMVRGPVGDQIAAFLQENRADLGIEYLIWQQRIWRPATSGAWRGMSSRGGDTANHMDHVHVTTYGNAAQ